MNEHAFNSTQTSLGDIIVRATEYLCKENQHGNWLDARTNASCIWAIGNCGLTKSHDKFVKYAITRLFEDSERDKNGLCWNFEVWDTSISAIAIKIGCGSDFSRRLSEIKGWLLEEYSDIENNFRNEPWETLWALRALLYLGKLTQKAKRLIKDCISWLLSMRNSEGVLVSPHYVGLLLSVMSHAFENVVLSNKEKRYYEKAIQQGISYLLAACKAKMKEEYLWNDEPWSIGLILHGLADSYKFDSTIFRDADFNNYLIRWCDENWDSSIGWTDVTDTSSLLVGLSEYYIRREIELSVLKKLSRSDIQKYISANVKFEFRESGSKPLTVYPIWKERKFKLKKRTCCLLMPFNEPWSNKIHKILRDILKRNGFQAIRPDDLYDRDVIEGIWKAINEAEIIIADCTGSNLNVFYELGIAQTIGKGVVLISQNIKDIPFDLQTQRVIVYKIENPQEVLEKKLPEVIDYIKEGKI